jgi:hypothetical protein
VSLYIEFSKNIEFHHFWRKNIEIQIFSNFRKKNIEIRIISNFWRKNIEIQIFSNFRKKNIEIRIISNFRKKNIEIQIFSNFWKNIENSKINFKIFPFSSAREIKPSQTDIGRKVIKSNTKPSQIYSRTTNQSSSSASSGTPNYSSLKSQSTHHRLPSSGLSGSGLANNSSNSSTNLSSTSHLASSLSSSILGGITDKSLISKDDDERGNGMGGQGGYNNHHDSHSSYNSYGSTIPTNHRYHPVNGVVSNDCNMDSLHSSRNGGQMHHRNPDIMKRSIKWVFFWCFLFYLNCSQSENSMFFEKFKKIQCFQRLL